MAYCRFGEDSDVYMYYSINGGYQFHLINHGTMHQNDFKMNFAENALLMLMRLKKEGLKVPMYAIERLAAEIVEENELALADSK